MTQPHKPVTQMSSHELLIESYRGPDHKASLRAAVELRKRLSTVEQMCVFAIRGRGASWQEIADILGTSRQAAWTRFHETSPDLIDEALGREVPE